jgi:DNA-binding MarR family transcriptional regulator
VSTAESKRRAELIARLAVLGELESTGTALFHQAAAASYGLGITDMKALQILLQEGPQTPGDLATRLGLTTGAVTSVVDRLARRGMVRRAPHPVDGRKVLVSADRQALAAGDNVYLSIGAAYAALHETFSTAELEFLERYLQASIALTQSEIAALGRRSAT